MANKQRGGGRAASGSGADAHRSRFERFLFSFMGPPQLGDPNEPSAATGARPAEVCGRCGRGYDEHEVARTSAGTFTHCPS